MSCPYCHSGRIAVEPGTSLTYPCPDCGGTGRLQRCERCNDAGEHLVCANGLWITVRCTRCQGTAGGQTMPDPRDCDDLDDFEPTAPGQPLDFNED